ncbi:MAG TPA: PAS domain-containing protein, partial [Prolixibacteraceae bacterium]
MKRDNKSEADKILRQRAEGLMKTKSINKIQQLADYDAMKLIHELEVYQVELELQNEELFRAKELANELASEKYAELYDLAPSAYFTLSKTGDIIELNLCGSEMLGKERSLLKKRSFSFFISDDTRPSFNLFLYKVFKSRSKETCELTLCAAGNIPMYVHLVGIADTTGEQCMVSVIDITGRKQVEQALQESEEKYRFLFANNPQPMYIFDIETLAFLEVNNAAINYYGYSRKEFLGMKLVDIRPAEDSDALVKDIERLSQGYNPAGEWRHIKKNGDL